MTQIGQIVSLILSRVLLLWLHRKNLTLEGSFVDVRLRLPFNLGDHLMMLGSNTPQPLHITSRAIVVVGPRWIIHSALQRNEKLLPGGTNDTVLSRVRRSLEASPKRDNKRHLLLCPKYSRGSSLLAETTTKGTTRVPGYVAARDRLHKRELSLPSRRW